jgi:phosphoglycolate phosphatase-like HAD superfamily hydrolase
VLFIDLDGTLLDVSKRHYATYVEVLAMPDIRGVPIPLKEYWGLRIENKPVNDILKRSRLFPPKYKTFIERFEERLETPEMLGLDGLRPGTETALGKLYTKTPIVLVTQRRDGEALESQLAGLGLTKYFVTVLSGAPPRLRRTDPEQRWKHKAQLIKDRYKLPPTESVYLGDTETDVKVARHFHWEVYLVENGHRKKELQIKADPDRIVPDLPGALKFLLPGGRWQR